MGAFDGKAVLVTGAASGIGRATAERLAQEGARVLVVDLDEDAGRAVADGIDGAFLKADVSAPDEIDSAVRNAVDAFGRLDIAHLNAGVGETVVDIATMDPVVFTRQVGVNVGGVVFGTKACANVMTQGGVVIATASLAGITPMPSDPIYTLTKHAVVGFVRSVAPPLLDKGIRVNAVCPGFVETPMIAAAVDSFRAAGFPLLQPEDVAEAVVRIATGDETGQVFIVQPGRPAEAYRFRGVPGPRTEGASGALPPRLA